MIPNIDKDFEHLKVKPEYTPSPYHFKPELAYRNGENLNTRTVMLGVGSLKVGKTETFENLGTEKRDRVEGQEVDFEILPEEEYVGDDWWVNGKVSPEDLHVTLKHGLVNPDPIDFSVSQKEVLSGWEIPSRAYTLGFDLFQGKGYEVVIAKVSQYEFQEAHDRLSCLPHIDFHHRYRPHVTLGYVKSGMGKEVISRFVEAHRPTLLDRSVPFFFFETNDIYWS